MATNYTINKTFSAFGGLNLRISDLLRSDNFATVADNVAYRKTGAMSKRKGYQILAESKGGYGITTFPDTDIESGDVTEQLVAVDDNLWKVEDDSFTITYSGSDTAYFDLFVDTDNKFKFEMYDNGAQVLSYDLGTGKELSFITLGNLITQINAISNFTASGTLTTESAAFIPVALGTTISSSGTNVAFQKWTQIDTASAITDPFSTFYAARNNADFENASFAIVNNILYISTGYDTLQKYDSLRVYKAGLPAPASAASVSKLGSGSLTGTYKYRYFYRHIDAKGNVVEGNATAETETTLSSEDARLTLQNLQANTGFNTSQAVVNGAQSGVSTITVDSGHTILVGDKVYFYDGSASEYTTRNVTAVTATTIVVDGAIVDVADDDIINPQLKIVVLRTVDGGTLFYEIAELVNDSANATQTYDDSAADSTLVIEFVDPAKPRDLPPKGKYIDVWRNTLIITGNRENPNLVYFSDIDGAEYFPALTNNFIIESNDGSKNSGIRSLDNILYVFKKNSIAGITGDLALNQFQVDIVNKQGIGCAAHATLAEIENEVWFLSEFGIYSISQSGLQKRSENIDPKFNQPNSLNFNRAVAFYWIDNDQYLIYLPQTATSSGNIYYTENSELYAYDTFRQAWTQWKNLDIGGGIADLNGRVYFQSKEIDSGSNQVHYLKRFHNDGVSQDYCDHESPISFTYKSNWETLGEPSLFKKFLRIKVHSLDASLNNFESEGFVLNVSTEHDYVISTVSSLILDFTGGAEGWGISPWDGFPWGEDRLSSLKSKLASQKAKSLRTVLENNELATNILISGYEYEVAVPYQMRIKE
jgi:hypothetical protein